MTDRDLTKSMNTLFPKTSKGRCRVCDEPVVDGRWSYCSERCRDIAQGVQKMFVWPEVRERILERDDYTCQECGLSKGMWKRAYWQAKELIRDKNPFDRQEEYSRWKQRDETLTERFGVEFTSGGFHVDHITPISEGGHKFDESNLRTLCKYCHYEKTAEENRLDGSEPARPDDEVTLEDYIEP